MSLSLLTLCLFAMALQTAWGQSGALKEKILFSRFLNADRHIQIYLPPSYGKEPRRRYPVLYLHDGQNVFSSAGTNICFGWGNWGLDRTVDELCRAGRLREIIMVAIDNSAARYQEYCGRSHAGEKLSATNNTPFENYESFLIRELKPRIDNEYRTRRRSADTGVMGSSMGGICSVILAWDHPEIFGGAASLSGAFQVEQTNFLNTILKTYHGKPKSTRIYLDSGITDFTGGDDGCALTGQVFAELRRIGWGKSLTRYVDDQPLTPAQLAEAGLRRDKWREAQTSQHNEFYWRLRAWRSLTFLFSP